MAKYDKLTAYLRSFKGDRWEVDFSELEALVGFPFPRSAHSYPAWWSNQKVDGHSQSDSWQSVGWKTAEVDVRHKRVVFIRQANPIQSGNLVSHQSEQLGLSIAQAKIGLSVHYGIPEEKIEITIRG